MNIIKRINNKSIKSKYFNDHKVSYYIIRVILLPMLLVVIALQWIIEVLDKIVNVLGNAVNKLSYFIYKIIHYKNLPNRDIEE